MIQREIVILGQRRTVCGDRDYLGNMGEAFEEDTTALLAALCDPGNTAVDIGANIGLTVLALSALCGAGDVLAVEAVPATFELLERNLATAGVQNVATVNVALGAGDGSVSMYVDASNLATSFVVSIDAGAGHEIPMTSLDTLISRQALQRLDFIKIDVEGCELEVLRGAEQTLARFQPIVLLEMNHWCLNVFRRVSLPEFRDRLLALFPCVYAVDQKGFLDFSDPLNAGAIYHAHVFENRYMNLVAGFNRDDLLARLGRLPMASSSVAAPGATHGRESAEQQLQALLDSTSWKLTAPLRRICHWVKTIKIA